MSKTARQRGKTEFSAGRPAPHPQIHDYAAVMPTPWTDLKLGIAVEDEAITCIDFLPGHAKEIAASTGIAAAAVRQLQNYFRDPRQAFDLPLAPLGTPFQQRIWSALQRISPGTTRRYGDLARQMGSSARAVGGACRANPIPLVIPCHRVVAAQGMGGFMGATAGRGLHIKQQLLAHEFTSQFSR